MAKTSAGLLLYRTGAEGGLEVLLVHPGGPFWARKDLGAWSIPKGEVEPDEDALSAAIREVREELGATFAGPFTALMPIRQRGGKRVEAWAIEGDLDVAGVVSATVDIEWPPRSGRRLTVPEIDRAVWFPLDEARRRILAAQQPLLDELAALVA